MKTMIDNGKLRCIFYVVFPVLLSLFTYDVWGATKEKMFLGAASSMVDANPKSDQPLANAEKTMVWFSKGRGSYRVYNSSATETAYLKVWVYDDSGTDFEKDKNDNYKSVTIPVEPKHDEYKLISYKELGLDEERTASGKQVRLRFAFSNDQNMTPTSATGSVEDYTIVFQDPMITKGETKGCGKEAKAEFTVTNLLKTGWVIAVEGIVLTNEAKYEKRVVGVNFEDVEYDVTTSTGREKRIQRRRHGARDRDEAMAMRGIIFDHQRYQVDANGLSQDLTSPRDLGIPISIDEDANREGATKFKFRLTPGSYKITVSNSAELMGSDDISKTKYPDQLYYFYFVVDGDFDCDGVADKDDVDDDNDGILDVEELFGIPDPDRPGFAVDADRDGVPATPVILKDSHFSYGEKDETLTFGFDVDDNDPNKGLGDRFFEEGLRGALAEHWIEGFDIDKDGVPNYLDQDSDGDGCLDALEGGTNESTDKITSADIVTTANPYSSFIGKSLCEDGSCVYPNGLPKVGGLQQTKGQVRGYSETPELNVCSPTQFKVSNTVAGGAVSENAGEPLVFEIIQGRELRYFPEDEKFYRMSNGIADTELKVTLAGGIDRDDIKKIVWVKEDGTEEILTGGQLEQLLTNGFNVTIPINSEYAPVFKVYPQVDTKVEGTETVEMNIRKVDITGTHSSVVEPMAVGYIVEDDCPVLGQDGEIYFATLKFVLTEEKALNAIAKMVLNQQEGIGIFHCHMNVNTTLILVNTPKYLRFYIPFQPRVLVLKESCT